MTADEFARRVGGRPTGAGKWQAKCPAHSDNHPSLSISEGLDGKVLIKCHAGCSLDAILNTLNSTVADLSGRSKGGGVKNEIVAEYDYHDASGNLIYQAVRFKQKDFRLRRPVAGGWAWDLKGVIRKPFNLPALVKANVALIVEGEKDALNLQPAACEFPSEDGKLIYAATCNVGGAGKWLEEYSPYMAGKTVYMFPDNDDPGRKHADQVCASVVKFAHAVRLVKLQGLPDKGDVSDYLEVHAPSELFAAMQATPLWTAPGPASQPTMTPEEAACITGKLLEECESFIRRYVVVSEDQAVIMAAWILHTYVHPAFDVTPYLFVSSPEKMSGKTILLTTLQAVACRPRFSSGMSGAALARVVETIHPTLFLDELDAQMKGNKETAESIRGILNSGFAASGMYTRCVGQGGNNFSVHDFPTFCPKCFAAIGDLWDTVKSRAIVIEMRRKLPEESVAPSRQKAVKTAAAPVKAALESWAAQGSVALLQELAPDAISGLTDRQNDIAEPLLSIAQLAGGGRLERLTMALRSTFKASGAEDSSIGTVLLADIREIFNEHHDTDHLRSKVLAMRLCEIEGHPWAEWSYGGKGLTDHNLARQLKKFNIRPQTIRDGNDTFKGYRRGYFEDAWERYCPVPSARPVTPLQPLSSLTETEISSRNNPSSVTVPESASNPYEQRGVTDVTGSPATQAGEQPGKDASSHPSPEPGGMQRPRFIYRARTREQWDARINQTAD